MLSKNANIQLLIKIGLLFDFVYIDFDERGDKMSNMDVIVGGSGGTVL